MLGLLQLTETCESWEWVKRFKGCAKGLWELKQHVSLKTYSKEYKPLITGHGPEPAAWCRVVG